MEFFCYLQIEPNTAFLRAARAGQLDTVVDLLDSGAVKDINTCNSVSFYYFL